MDFFLFHVSCPINGFDPVPNQSWMKEGYSLVGIMMERDEQMERTGWMDDDGEVREGTCDE